MSKRKKIKRLKAAIVELQKQADYLQSENFHFQQFRDAVHGWLDSKGVPQDGHGRLDAKGHPDFVWTRAKARLEWLFEGSGERTASH